MILKLLRGLFLVLVASVASLYLLPFQLPGKVYFGGFVSILAITLGLSAFVIAVDVLTPRKKLSAVSGVFLGLLAGLLAAYALSFVVNLIGILVPAPWGVEDKDFAKLLEGVKVVIGLITCYLGISLVLQTKDDFRFVIPYVEFTKQIRGTRPILLDTSVIIDGRVFDIAQTNVLAGTMIVPKFILNELQGIADSSDKLRRARGRRGLDVLQKLQDSPVAEVSIEDADGDGATVDQQLVAVARQMNARIMTGDFNLAKIANLRGLEVININDLTKAVRPVVLPGETMRVKIVKPGEGAGQGVGYLDDGTMVVVENARPHIGHEMELTVTSTLQTSAGRMIFGRCGPTDGTERVKPSVEPQRADDPGDASAQAEEAGPQVPRSGGRNPRRKVRSTPSDGPGSGAAV